ncbi:hypothetical protein [Bdellovibrio sp. HCB209]|uniref:hypothetical protein n=1 Tax=Bdellovibrio sp. HCB209 TaxID=3394354 RepID=UPI0039B63FCA
MKILILFIVAVGTSVSAYSSEKPVDHGSYIVPNTEFNSKEFPEKSDVQGASRFKILNGHRLKKGSGTSIILNHFDRGSLNTKDDEAHLQATIWLPNGDFPNIDLEKRKDVIVYLTTISSPWGLISGRQVRKGTLSFDNRKKPKQVTLKGQSTPRELSMENIPVTEISLETLKKKNPHLY